MNRITWQASTYPAIASYTLQSSPDNETWSALASVTHTIPGPNWDSTNSVFYYDDAAGATTTWYRLRAVDTLSQVSDWSAAFQATGQLVPVWEMAGDIINKALVEVGLAEVSDPFASTDPNVKQMTYLLSAVGRRLVLEKQWTHLRREHTFTTVTGQSSYDLPADYRFMLDQTWWNRTNRLPVGGPMSPQEWQYLKARLAGVVFTVLFRPMERRIHVYPDTNTPGGYEIAFEYVSAFWVSGNASPNTVTADRPSNSNDYCWFDGRLLVDGLKLWFLKAKGFDTTAAQQDYDTTLALVRGADSPSPVLNLNRSSMALRYPLIGGQSVPITGFGT